jgi:hypothetical protein
LSKDFCAPDWPNAAVERVIRKTESVRRATFMWILLNLLLRVRDLLAMLQLRDQDVVL